MSPLARGGPSRARPRIADLYEDEIVGIRKELTDAGFDGGAETIRFHMATPGAHRAVNVDHLASAQSPGLCHP